MKGFQDRNKGVPGEIERNPEKEWMSSTLDCTGSRRNGFQEKELTGPGKKWKVQKEIEGLQERFERVVPGKKWIGSRKGKGSTEEKKFKERKWKDSKTGKNCSEEEKRVQAWDKNF